MHLPDPLSAAPVSSASTDDLLAQLAGEEIERLLAEADEPPASSKLAVVAPIDQFAPPAASPAQNTGASTHSSLLEPPTTTPTKIAVPAFKGAQSSPSPEAELSTLFLEIENSAPATASGQAAPIKTATASELDSAPSAADALAQEMLEDAATSPSGRAAFSSTATASATSHASARAHETSEGESLPFRILGWLNRPLDPYPDHVRDLVGKIAIVTIVNAAAVLAYVLIFRGH
jgi:hypothetical protein